PQRGNGIMASKEFDEYRKEKQEEGRRIDQDARPAGVVPRRTRQELDAARTGMRRDCGVPPDAEGQEGAGHIEQTRTSSGNTRSR
ncbi:MAG TPA: hypothetical protein VK943_02005, partial [Arenibaculum sp.]|nr:hypothetical protein [Arenibaculum sp.]